ncbi:MAG: hypothetical protein LBN95_12175 [Prevotellaceae bacterium]|jgi:hypothetical protein|nr:hypothetical protein [Prevotellaceae bacterium]
MKKLFIIIIIFVSTISVVAQKTDTLVRNIQIERDYTPEIAPVARPDVPLGITEPTIEKSNTTFSQFSKPFDVEKGEFIPISPEKMTAIEREKAKAGFLRLGFGPLFTWKADLWYPVWNTKDGYFDIDFHHDAILGVVKPTKKLINTGLGINFNKNFGDNQFYLGAKYDNEFFNYYGRDTAITNLDTVPNQSFNKADFTLGMRSNKRTDSGWLYDAYLNYHLFAASRNTKIAEHNINAAVRADIEWDKHHLDVEFGLQSFFYQNTNSSRWRKNVIVRLLPAYLLSTEKINLRLGVKTFFDFGKGNDVLDWVAITPDVKLDYFYTTFLNLYVGITGDYQINSLANITSENRYYALPTATYNNTYTPFDIFGGFKVKITKGLLLDAFLSYKYVNKEVFFDNNWAITNLYGTGQLVFNRFFNPFELNGMLFNAGVRINYDYKENLNIFAQMKYNKWNVLALHTPALEVNAGTNFKIGKGFFGSVNFYAASKMQALRSDIIDIIDLPAVFDLNLGAGYNIKKNISLFAQANNILALSPKLNYQRWYGYNSFGANLLVGATVLF